MKKLLTLSQLAEYLQVSKEKLYKMAQDGKIPASKVGGSWRFKLKRIDKWIDERENVRPKKRTKRRKD